MLSSQIRYPIIFIKVRTPILDIVQAIFIIYIARFVGFKYLFFRIFVNNYLPSSIKLPSSYIESVLYKLFGTKTHKDPWIPWCVRTLYYVKIGYHNNKGNRIFFYILFTQYYFHYYFVSIFLMMRYRIFLLKITLYLLLLCNESFMN